MLLLASILLLSLERVTSAPQLRLSHTGYEIISFDDQTTDDSLPTATKLTLQNVSRPNLEKPDSVDDDSETLLNRLNKLQLQLQLPVEQHKSQHELQPVTNVKTTPQIRRNAVDTSLKGLSSVPNEKTNIYLAVGIPTRFEHPSHRTKEFPSFTSSETSKNILSKNSLDDSHEKRSNWIKNSRVDKKTKNGSKIVKQSISNQASDKVSTIIDSDFDSSDSKEDSKFDKMTAILADTHRSFDKIGTKSDFEEKQEKIDTPNFPTIGKLPSIQIHRQRNFYLPSKSPSMFSPIYPSGFDIVAKNFVKKSILSINEPSHIHPTNLQSESKNFKNFKYADGDNNLKKLPGYEMKDFSNGAKEFTKSHQRDKISSLMILKNILDNVNHDFNPRTVNRLPLAGILPVTGTSLYVSPLSLMFQKSLRPLRPSNEKHLELNSKPLIDDHVERNHPIGDLSIFHSQGRLEDIIINSVNDAPKMMLDNYLENKYLDSKVNSKRMEMLRSKNDFLRKYLKIHNLNSQTPIQNNMVNKPAKEVSMPNLVLPKSGLVIDVVHEIVPDDSEEIIFDSNKENSAKDVQKIQDTLQAPSSHSPMSCKHMKPITPPFYQFLAKFSDIILDNAQKYETSLQIRDGATKLIEAYEAIEATKLIEVVKKKNSGNISEI